MILKSSRDYKNKIICDFSNAKLKKKLDVSIIVLGIMFNCKRALGVKCAKYMLCFIADVLIFFILLNNLGDKFLYCI